MDLELFEDLQLTQLMPDCDFTPALSPCDREELPVRQEFFRALEAPAFRSHLADLHRSVSRMRLLCEGYETASCSPEAQVVFAALMAETLRFCEFAASDGGDGLLRARFADFFRGSMEQEEMK
jgi:hypothetical protein